MLLVWGDTRNTLFITEKLKKKNRKNTTKVKKNCLHAWIALKDTNT